MSPTSELQPRLRGEVDVRERLRRDLPRVLYVSAWVMVGVGVSFAGYVNLLRKKFGIDSHAYWLAWHGPMYTFEPTDRDAYLYSPAFAQALWPASHLPWPVFAVGFAVMDGALLAWLLSPLRWKWRVPVFLVLLPEVASSNIYIPLAVMCVLGFRCPGAWALSALTKVVPTVMPVWWLVRREWHSLAVWAVCTVGSAVVSFAIAPDLWLQWGKHLVLWARDSGRTYSASHMVALPYRAPVGIALLVLGAHKGWRWTIPVAALFCTPVFWLGSYAWLGAIPRLQQQPQPPDQNRSGSRACEARVGGRMRAEGSDTQT